EPRGGIPMKGYVAQKGNRWYAVIYEGIDRITGRERRSLHAAGRQRVDAERLPAPLASDLEGDRGHGPRDLDRHPRPRHARRRPAAGPDGRTRRGVEVGALSHRSSNRPSRPKYAGPGQLPR